MEKGERAVAVGALRRSARWSIASWLEYAPPGAGCPGVGENTAKFGPGDREEKPYRSVLFLRSRSPDPIPRPDLPIPILMPIPSAIPAPDTHADSESETDPIATPIPNSASVPTRRPPPQVEVGAGVPISIPWRTVSNTESGGAPGALSTPTNTIG